MKVTNSAGAEGDGARDLRHDRITNSALDAAIVSSTQTYDQFLQGFVHLTAADVAPSVMQNAFGGTPTSPPPLFLQNSRSERSHSPPLFLRPETPARPPSPPLADASTSKTDEDFEEVLDCCEPVSSKETREPRTKSLQMDNYVVDEGSDDDELQELGSEYTASFTIPANPQTDVERRNTGSHAEQTSTLSSPKKTEIDRPYDCQILPDNEKPCVVDEPCKDEHDSDKDRVNLSANKPAVRQAEQEEEESILELIKGCELSEAKSEDEEELVYDPSLDRPNPGEVDDLDDRDVNDVVTNVREMVYSARMAEPGELPTNTYKPNEETVDDSPVYDSVEAFSLDEDFDYDNVILTPKFTPQEQKELDEWARQGREEAEAERQKEKNDAES